MISGTEQKPRLSESQASMYLSYYLDTIRRCGGLRGKENQRWITKLDESVIDHIDDVVEYYKNTQYTVYADGKRFVYDHDELIGAFSPRIWKNLVDYNIKDVQLQHLKRGWIHRAMELGVFPQVCRDEQLYMLAEALQQASSYDVSSWPAWWRQHQHLFLRYTSTMNDLMDAARLIPEDKYRSHNSCPWVVLFVQSKMGLAGNIDFSTDWHALSLLLREKSNGLYHYQHQSGNFICSDVDIHECNHWWQCIFQHMMDAYPFTLETFLDYMDLEVQLNAKMDYPYSLIQPADNSARIALLLFHCMAQQIPDRLSPNTRQWLDAIIVSDPQIHAWIHDGALNIWNLYADTTGIFNPLTDLYWANRTLELDEQTVFSKSIERMVTFFENINTNKKGPELLDTRCFDL